MISNFQLKPTIEREKAQKSDMLFEFYGMNPTKKDKKIKETEMPNIPYQHCAKRLVPLPSDSHRDRHIC